MADFCLYKVGDVVWDDFGEVDDHIVPHPCSVKRFAVEDPTCENLKKREADKMLENGSWSYSCNDVFAYSCGGGRKRLQSDQSEMSTYFKSMASNSVGRDFPCENAILTGSCTPSGNGILDMPSAPLSNLGSDMNIFRNDHEERESDSALYYGWPDFGSFDDVDGILRDCDSSYGLDNLSASELCWFAPSNIMEEEDVVENVFKTELDCKEMSTLDNTGVSNEGSNGVGVSLAKVVTSCCMSDADELGTHNFPFHDGSSQSSGSNGLLYSDVSIEAASFGQLHGVIEQLDMQTRHRMRDSLYRLARSAERRRSTEYHDGGHGDAIAFVEEANKCAEYAQLEVHTNPIDRSVAHLLFHNPSGSSSL